MLQRLIAAVLGVLGLAAIVLGIASATVWRADDTLTATARAADGTTLLTTAPGVLETGDPPVTVRASADGGTKVVVAIGRDTDVAAWVGTDAHTVVTGLQDWHTLATDDVASSAAVPEGAEETAGGEAAPSATAPDPDGSDLWIEQATGEGRAEMVWTPQPGRWTLLVATAGENAGPPTVELSWPRTVTTPWLVPGVVGGAVLLLLALLLALRSRRARRRGEEWQTVTGATPVVAADDARADGESEAALSRRQRRDAAAAAAAAAATARQAAKQARASAPPTGETATVSTAAAGGATAPDPRAAATPAAPADPATRPGSDAATDPTPVVSTAAVPTDDVPTDDVPTTTAFTEDVPGTTEPTGDAEPAASSSAGATAIGADDRGATEADPTPDGADPTGTSPTAPGGSRADAWRRAWGFPGGGADPGAGARTDGEDH